MSTPTERFIWPIDEHHHLRQTDHIGTARKRKNAARVALESMLPWVAMVSADEADERDAGEA